MYSVKNEIRLKSSGMSVYEAYESERDSFIDEDNDIWLRVRIFRGFLTIIDGSFICVPYDKFEVHDDCGRRLFPCDITCTFRETE